jgi:quinoprotein glucose dehydrogenase
LHQTGWQGRAGRLLAVANIIGFALFAPSMLRAQTIPGALPESTAALARGEWPAYAGTYASSRYSPLTQIDRDSAKKLHVAWRWKIAGSGDQGRRSKNRPEQHQ